MYVLVTFCNTLKDTNYYRKLCISQVGILDLDRLNIFFIDVPTEVNSHGFSGIAVNEKYVYLTSQERDNPRIIRYVKKSLDIATVYELKEVKDPHSLIILDNTLYIASTGTNSVEMYDAENLKYKGKHWQHPKTTTVDDQVHLNSVFERNGQIWCSAFGKKTGLKWSSANNGYLINTSNNTKLYEINHPHSARIYNGDIVYCESRTSKIFENGKKIKWFKHSYTRGLDINEKYVAVGISSGRQVSRSRHSQNNPAESGKFVSTCGVTLINRETKMVNFIDLSNFFREIFEVRFVSGLRVMLPKGVVGTSSTQQLSGIKENHLVTMLVNDRESLIRQTQVLSEKLESKDKELQTIHSSKLYKILVSLRELANKFAKTRQ